MRKIAFILIIIMLLGSIGYFVLNSIKQNTKYLNEIEPAQIEDNNATTRIPNESDMQNLKRKLVIVPNIYKNDFDSERELNLPESLNIGIFAAGLQGPRFLTFDKNNNVFVTDKTAGKVYLIKDSNNDNVGEQIIEVDSGLRSVHGIEYYENDLYVAEETQILVYRDINDIGEYSAKQILVPNLPGGNIISPGGGHTTRTIKIGPDKKMYVSVGSSCNVCEETDSRRAAILRYNLDGTGEEIFAYGLRNTVGFIFDKNNRMWGVDNGRDLIGDNIPPEEVNIIQISNHYGWPYCYGRGNVNPEYPDKKDFCENTAIDPIYEMQAHSAPLGLDFSPWPNLTNNLFIAFHGSWNRTTPTGYKVVRIDTSSKYAEPVNFITGWLLENGDAWGRPTDVRFYKDNKMLITDDKIGVIYIVYPN